MRPKKVILVLSTDDQVRSELCFLLAVQVAYRPIACALPAEALEVLSWEDVDLILIEATKDLNAAQVSLSMKKLKSHVPLAILGVPTNMLAEIHGADAVVDKRTVTSAELLERIKVWSARKRGPRKSVVRAQPLVLAAAVGAD